MDYRVRYKPLFRCNSDDYAVIEEHSKTIVDAGPLTYEQALAKADRRNETRAQQVRQELEGA